MFCTKSHKFLEFSKSQSETSKIHQFDYGYISAVRCTGESGQMTKLETVATMHNSNFMGGGGGGLMLFVPLQNNLQKTLTKANMSVK